MSQQSPHDDGREHDCGDQPERGDTQFDSERLARPPDASDATGLWGDGRGESRDRTPPPVPSVGGPAQPDDDTLDEPQRRSSREQTLPAIEGFQILRELGHGGMGVVYKARQLRPNRIVALKMILTGQYASTESLLRFRNEAELVARLHHPHIVQVFSVGEHEGHPYFVMEYMDGGTVAHGMRRQRQSSVREAAELVETMARACQFAHERRIVHRDIKPGNVLLTKDGFPKLADFGLAKNLGRDMDLTAKSQILGTLEYMAPEQAWGKAKEVSVAADIYSLGVMLYELLTGRRPFEADSDAEVLVKIRNEETPSPAWLKPGLPRDLETICMKCLRKDAAKRYASAVDLAEDLRRFREGCPIVGRRPSAAERIKSQMRYHPLRALVILVAIVLVVIAGLGTWWFDAYHWERTRHFSSYIRRWGVIHGLAPVPHAVQPRRAYTYKFVYRGRRGPLVRVEVVNHRGIPENSHGGALLIPGIRDAVPRKVIECVYTFQYDQAGRLSSETGLDTHGRPIWQLRYEYGSAATDPKPRRLRARFHDHRGNVAQTSGGASSVTLDMNDQGHVVWLRYLGSDAAESPRMDDNGVYGQRYTYRNGYLRSQTNVDADGDPVANRHGVVQELYTQHARFGTAAIVEYVDGKGRPVPVHTGYHRVTYGIDQYGNTNRVRYVGIDGRAVESEYGYAMARIEYGDQYREYQWYNTRNRLIGRQRWAYDLRTGRAVSRELQVYVDDNLVSVKRREELTADGAVSKVTTVHADDSPMKSEIHDRDALNRVEKTMACNASGSVVKTTVWQYKGSRPSRMTIRERSDGEMRIVEDEQYEYDDPFGRKTRTIRFAADGRTIAGATDYRYRPDSLFAHEWVEYGPGGSEFLRRVVVTRDSRGKPLTETYFDRNGERVPGSKGYSDVVQTFEGGLISRVEYRGFVPDHPFARHLQVFDRFSGEIKDESYVDADGELASGPRGFARETTQYNDWGYWIAYDQVGFDGSNGYRIAAHSRDLASKTERTEYLDSERKPARHRSGNQAYTTIRDDHDRVITKVYEGFDALVPYERMIERFDDHERLMRVEYRDAQGRPAPCQQGFTDQICRYSDSGRLIAYELLGYDDGRIGFSRRHVTLDQRGLMTEARLFDANGRPVVSAPLGYAVERAEFDEQQRQTRLAYFDLEGRPVRNRIGDHSEIRYVYPSDGHAYRAIGSGSDGAQGYESFTQEFDSEGRLIEFAYLQADGTRATSVHGYSSIEARYGADGELLTVEHRDASGRRARGSFQVAVVAVVPYSQADLIGLRAGDVITAYNQVAGSSHLVLQNERTRIQDQLDLIEIDVVREGRTLNYAIRPGTIGVYWEDIPRTVNPQCELESL